MNALVRDPFGFHKVIVAITSTGKIFGIHSSNGAILWSRILGLESGKLVKDFKMKVVNSVLDGATIPGVAVVANTVDSPVSRSFIVFVRRFAQSNSAIVTGHGRHSCESAEWRGHPCQPSLGTLLQVASIRRLLVARHESFAPFR
jgi:hypothetical protein